MVSYFRINTDPTNSGAKATRVYHSDDLGAAVGAALDDAGYTKSETAVTLEGNARRLDLLNRAAALISAERRGETGRETTPMYRGASRVVSVSEYTALQQVAFVAKVVTEQGMNESRHRSLTDALAALGYAEDA